MRADVVISIRPNYIAQIYRGEKNVEIRKSRPKLKTPFRALVYCTSRCERIVGIIKPGDVLDPEDGVTFDGDKCVFIKADMTPYYLMDKKGKICGEAVIDRVGEITLEDADGREVAAFDGEHPKGYRTGDVTVKEFKKYRGEGKAWGWHIEKFTLYDEGMDLSEAGLKCAPQSWAYAREKRGD